MDSENNLDPRRDEEASKEVLNRIVYAAGRTVIEQGDTGMRAYFIESGRVEVIVEDPPHQLKVTELGAGDIFGEMSLLSNDTRTATVKAVKATTVTVISHEDLQERIEKIDDKLLKALIKVLVKRLQDTTQGQMHQYKSLSEFQGRITGMVDRVQAGIDMDDRDAFRSEIEPLLDQMQAVFDKYQD